MKSQYELEVIYMLRWPPACVEQFLILCMAFLMWARSYIQKIYLVMTKQWVEISQIMKVDK